MDKLRAAASVAFIAAAAVLACGCAAAAGTGASDPVPPTEPIELVVLHTNDLWGETDPCG